MTDQTIEVAIEIALRAHAGGALEIAERAGGGG